MRCIRHCGSRSCEVEGWADSRRPTPSTARPIQHEGPGAWPKDGGTEGQERSGASPELSGTAAACGHLPLSLSLSCAAVVR